MINLKKYYISLESWGTTSNPRSLDFFFDVYALDRSKGRQKIKDIKNALKAQKAFKVNVPIGLGTFQQNVLLQAFWK